MDSLNNIVITKIKELYTVYSPKGRKLEIKKRNSFALSFCEEGQITYTHNGQEFVSNKNCVIIIPKGKSYTLNGDKTGYFPVIDFDCEFFHPDTFTVIPSPNVKSLTKMYEQIQRLSLFKENHHKVMSIFYDMLHLILGEQTDEKSVLRPAIKYLEENISNPYLSNKALADKANISEVYFRKLFTLKYRISPRQYILNVRIEKAKKLLADANKKIVSIASECGFQSVYHFSRCFKQKTGFTPTEYMNQNQITKI